MRVNLLREEELRVRARGGAPREEELRAPYGRRRVNLLDLIVRASAPSRAKKNRPGEKNENEFIENEEDAGGCRTEEC